MEPKECVEILFDSQYTIEEKAKTLSEYFEWSIGIARSVKLGKTTGISAAVHNLREALPEGDKGAFQRLDDVLLRIGEHWAKEKQAHKVELKNKMKELRGISSGTCIVIINENREELVYLVETKRTRFVAEYPDGRRYSVSPELFLGVHKGEPPKRLSEDERTKRDIIRGLAGSHYSFVKGGILEKSNEMLPVLLDELKSAIERVENAPAGLSKGTLGSSLGIIKKINPQDEVLIKRIPQVITEIGERMGKESVQRIVDKYPDPKVRDYCSEADKE